MFKIFALICIVLPIISSQHGKKLTFDCNFKETGIWIKPSIIKLSWMDENNLQLYCEMESLYGGEVYWATNNTNSKYSATKYAVDKYNFEKDYSIHSIITTLDITSDMLKNTQFICIGNVNDVVCKFPFVIHQ